MPAFRLLRPAEYRVMPWKNGLGTTTEIAVHPPGASLDAFTWRVSIADLGASGPFSTFAGCDRVLVQIEGAPMTLSHAGSGEHTLRLLSPYRFAGELSTYGALAAPPARDFNVMVRRDLASAEVSVHELAEGAAARSEGEVDTWVVYVLRGAVKIGAERGRRRAPGAYGTELLSNETFLVAGATALAMTAAGEGATVILVAIGPPGRAPAGPT